MDPREADPIPMFELAMRVDRLEVPVMFRAAPKIEAALRAVAFVVERFEDPVTFMAVAKRPAAFITRAFPLV